VLEAFIARHGAHPVSLMASRLEWRFIRRAIEPTGNGSDFDVTILGSKPIAMWPDPRRDLTETDEIGATASRPATRAFNNQFD
jgi:hypothetical protein